VSFYRRFILFLALGAVGCQSNVACQRQLAALRGEKIAWEDKYYEMEAKYRAAVGDSNSTWATPEECAEPVIFDPATPANASPSPTPHSESEVPRDPADLSRSTAPQADRIDVVVDPGEALSTVAFQPPRHVPNRSSNIPNHPPPATRELRIVDPYRLRGRETDGTPGDDGVAMALRLPAAVGDDGELLVAVLDPQQAGEQQRVGFWRFSASELAPQLKGSTSAPTVALDLPWNQSRPQHENLTLFVRWNDSLGPLLELSQAFSVVPSPADADRELPAAGPELDSVPANSGGLTGSLERSIVPPQTWDWSPQR
jgi:hypothetical protein